MEQMIKKLLREGLESAGCDCCGYFDMKSLNDYGFDMPLYRYVEKWEDIKLVFMSPEEYITAISKGFGNFTRTQTMQAVSRDLIDQYSEAMLAGDKFPVGYYKEGKSGQEGRHRALAADWLGCEKIPVVVIKELDYDTVMAFVAKYKDYTIEDFNRMYSEYPFKGVTQIGYNSFQRKLNLL